MIPIANKAAKKSQYKHRLGAVVVKSGRIVAVGYNKVGHYTPYNIWLTSIHAEVNAIEQLLKPKHFHKLQNAKIYVSRIRKNGNTGLAKPCSQCLKLIKSVGIKEIIYTTDFNTTERIKLNGT